MDTEGARSLISLENGNLVSGSNDSIRIWNKGRLLKTIFTGHGNLKLVSLLKNGNLVTAGGYEDNEVKI